MTSVNAFIDVFMGHRDSYALQQAEYDSTLALLDKNHKIYGLPPSPGDLSEEQQQILAELDVYASASVRRDMIL